ncbi:hypothetical protein [Natronococcus occultus]|nr:hypothetical protein [Natronococcus occultus]
MDSAAFDPETDEGCSLAHITIKRTYDKLQEEGYEDEAESLREPGGQRQKALKLRKEHLQGWDPLNGD